MNISIVYTSTIVDLCEAYVAVLCGGEQRLRGGWCMKGEVASSGVYLQLS